MKARTGGKCFPGTNTQPYLVSKSMKVAMAFKAVQIWETAKPLTFFWLRQSISMVMKNKGSRFMAGRIFRKESEKTSELD